MRILYATMQFGRGYGQGTERYVGMLAEGMQRRGHQIAIVAGDPQSRGPRLSLGEEFEQDPRVIACPTHGLTCVRGVSPRRWLPILRREQPDLVHVANPAQIGVGIVSAARDAGIPVVATIMDYWWLCPKHTLSHFQRGICDANVTWPECLRCIAAADTRSWVRTLASIPAIRGAMLPALYLGRALMRGTTPAELGRWMRRQSHLIAALDAADAVIFPSRGTRQAIEPRLNHTHVHAIPYGLEPRWFGSGRREPPGHGERDPKHLTLGFAGALEPHKGPHLVLEALRDLGWTATRTRFAGGVSDETYRERLHKLADGLNVELAGRLPSDQMPAFLRELDLLVLPSIWPENLPIVMLEAQAVGVPVLASDIAGVTEMITDPAMLFDVDSAASLAQRLAEWARVPKSPPPAQAVAAADEMVEQTAAVYTEVGGTS